MFKEIPDLLDLGQLTELRRIAAAAEFVDGRISNPHSRVKDNLQLNDQDAYERSSRIVLDALYAHEDFVNFAFPRAVLPPLMTRYTRGMRYGAHPDAAYVGSASGPQRTDLSCTVFINEPGDYEGGALRIRLGTRDMRFRGSGGSAIVYPSDMLHEVEAVSRGERLVAITFIESRIPDHAKRLMLHELNEVAALEGLTMKEENFSRLQLVQQNLLRLWGDRC